MYPPTLTGHAIERWQQRVAPLADAADARIELSRFLIMARARPRPRHWMRCARTGPGVRFAYWSGRPGVCAIIQDGAAVTVVTRALYAGRPRRRHPPSLRAVPDRRPERWRWDGRLGEAA